MNVYDTFITDNITIRHAPTSQEIIQIIAKTETWEHNETVNNYENSVKYQIPINEASLNLVLSIGDCKKCNQNGSQSTMAPPTTVPPEKTPTACLLSDITCWDDSGWENTRKSDLIIPAGKIVIIDLIEIYARNIQIEGRLEGEIILNNTKISAEAIYVIGELEISAGNCNTSFDLELRGHWNSKHRALGTYPIEGKSIFVHENGKMVITGRVENGLPSKISTSGQKIWSEIKLFAQK